MATNIEIILARDVPQLGKVGDMLKVKPGYARNFLFPKRFALPVSSSRLKVFEHQKQLIAHQLLKLRSESEKVRDQLSKLTITITAKVGDQGKLFGSIGTRAIEECLLKEGYAIHHRDIKLDSPIKSIGLHKVPVRLEADVSAEIKVMVVAEKIEEPATKSAEDAESAEASTEEISSEGDTEVEEEGTSEEATGEKEEIE